MDAWNRVCRDLAGLAHRFGLGPLPARLEPNIHRIVPNDGKDRQRRCLDHLIPSNTKIEVLASGMKFAKGPVWVREGGYLLFSDVPCNSVMKWKEGEGLTSS
jgi:hypothetical protein